MHAPDEQVMRFKSGVLILLGSCLFVYVFITNLNLMLGFEREHTATVTVEVQPGTHPSHRHLFKTTEGEQFERTVKANRAHAVGVVDDSQVKIVTDGLLWTEVVAVDSGEGLKRYR